MQVQGVCHDTLPWLISFSLGLWSVSRFFTPHSRCCFFRALQTRSSMRFSLHHRTILEKRKHVTLQAAAFSRFASVQTGTSSVSTRYRASVILSLMMLLLPLSAS